jgi:hypothetical protein
MKEVTQESTDLQEEKMTHREDLLSILEVYTGPVKDIGAFYGVYKGNFVVAFHDEPGVYYLQSKEQLIEVDQTWLDLAYKQGWPKLRHGHFVALEGALTRSQARVTENIGITCTPIRHQSTHPECFLTSFLNLCSDDLSKEQIEFLQAQRPLPADTLGQYLTKPGWKMRLKAAKIFKGIPRYDGKYIISTDRFHQHADALLKERGQILLFPTDPRISKYALTIDSNYASHIKDNYYKAREIHYIA